MPAGLVSDGASIPKIFWSIITSPFHPKIVRGAFIHDYLFRVHIVPRKVADQKLNSVIKSDGMDRTKAYLIYRAVRDFGKPAFKAGPKKPLIGVA